MLPVLHAICKPWTAEVAVGLLLWTNTGLSGQQKWSPRAAARACVQQRTQGKLGEQSLSHSPRWQAPGRKRSSAAGTGSSDSSVWRGKNYPRLEPKFSYEPAVQHRVNQLNFLYFWLQASRCKFYNQIHKVWNNVHKRVLKNTKYHENCVCVCVFMGHGIIEIHVTLWKFFNLTTCIPDLRNILSVFITINSISFILIQFN